MGSHVVTLAEVDSTLAAEWAFLEESAQHANPFYSREYLQAAATNLPYARQMKLFIGEDAGRLTWLLPLVPSRRLGRVPTVRGLRNRWPHIFFGQPLVVPGHESAAAAALSRHVGAHRGVHWLRLQHLLADDPFTRALLGESPPSTTHVQSYSRGYVVRRDEPTYLEGHSNLRRLLRKRRSFEKASGTSIDLIDRSEDAAALEEFMLLEASGWKGRDGGAFLSNSSDANFLSQVGAAFRQRGRLRLWSLQTRGETLAMKLNLVVGDTIFCFLIAYDETQAALSPGLQLEVENFRLFHDDPQARFMDSCAAPDNEFVNRLYPERRQLLDITVGTGRIGRVVTGLARVSGR